MVPGNWTWPPGRSSARSARHTGADFLRFLKVISRQHRARELPVILDNSSTHKTLQVQAWVLAHPRVHFHFTPAGASWLNMVEPGSAS